MPRIRTNKVRNYSCLRYDEGVELCTRLNVYRSGELFHSDNVVGSALRALSLTITSHGGTQHWVTRGRITPLRSVHGRGTLQNSLLTSALH